MLLMQPSGVAWSKNIDNAVFGSLENAALVEVGTTRHKQQSEVAGMGGAP